LNPRSKEIQLSITDRSAEQTISTGI